MLRTAMQKFMVYRAIMALCLMPLGESAVQAQRRGGPPPGGAQQLRALQQWQRLQAIQQRQQLLRQMREAQAIQAREELERLREAQAIRAREQLERLRAAQTPVRLTPETRATNEVPVSPGELRIPPMVMPPNLIAWQGATAQLRESPLGGLTRLLGEGAASGFGFLKDSAPDLSGSLSGMGRWLSSGAASLLSPLANVAGALPSISGVAASISNAAEAVSNTASHALKPIYGAADSIARVSDSITSGIESLKRLIWGCVAVAVVVILLKLGRWITR
jgi:hypothetical protein